MIEVKKINYTRKLNYILIPVTQTDDYKAFNEVFLAYRRLDSVRIERTPSGGISIKGLSVPGRWDIRTFKWGCEFTYCGHEDEGIWHNDPIRLEHGCGMFRLQFRNKIFEDEKTNSKISGKQALNKFYKELKAINIDLNNYAIENGKEIKEQIESPLIQLEDQEDKDKIFENCHHIDINSSYPAGVKEYHPEFAPVIDKWYELKKQGHKEYKAYLNLMIGTMQSQFVGYKYADISKYAIKLNNDKIRAMAQWLKDNGRKVLLYNTDGIWFQGEPYLNGSDKLGEFKQDHTNCKFRAKSNGAYEFIENGKYTPVIRGKTKLDETKPREEWNWGDIYQNDAQLIIKYELTEGGLEKIYEFGN